MLSGVKQGMNRRSIRITKRIWVQYMIHISRPGLLGLSGAELQVFGYLGLSLSLSLSLAVKQ